MNTLSIFATYQPNFIQVRKIFTRFVGLALVAVVVYSCGKKSDATGADSSSKEGAAAGDLKIAYVHTDSVINKYDFFKKKSEEITEKGKKLDLDLQARAKGFEQEVAMFQQTGGNLTQNQIRAKQDELMQKEQNLVNYRDNLMRELSTDESTLLNDVYLQVQEFMKEYAKENGIDFSSKDDLVKNAQIIDFYTERINQCTESLGQVEKIKKFVLLPMELTQEAGELTPTSKLKRKIINEKY